MTDVLLSERDQALAAAAERAAKTAHGVLIDTDQLTGSVDEAVERGRLGRADAGAGLAGPGRVHRPAARLGQPVRRQPRALPGRGHQGRAPEPHGLVGVGVADLDSCGDALTFAFEEASLRQASLLALHAWHTPRPRSPGPVRGPTNQAPRPRRTPPGI